jgi:hypothetical protein
MATKLQLEYACTLAEMREAESLSLRQQLGGGSKRKTLVVLFVILGALLVLGYFMLKMEVPQAYRPHAVAGFIVLCFVFFVWKRRSQKQPSHLARIEISEEGISSGESNPRIFLAWPGLTQFFESPTIFAMVDQTKLALIVIPKRAFPDETSINWFRSLGNHRHQAAVPSLPNIPPSAELASSGDVRLKFKLGYSDYLSRSAASWQTRLAWFAVLALVVGLSIRESFHPSPTAVYSPAIVLFVIALPILVILLPIITCLITFYSWITEKSYLLPQHLVLADSGLEFRTGHEIVILPWTTYARFKESRWNFFIWKPRSSLWLMLPKRAFAGPADIDRCRSLLSQKLRRSTWFFL